MRAYSIKATVTIVALFLLASTGFSQYIGYQPVADLSAFKTKYIAESAKIQSISSDFTQNKSMAAITGMVTSKGKFWFQRSNKLRMEYTTPNSYVMVMDGDKVNIRENGKDNKMNAGASKLFKEINRVVLDCIQGTILDSKDFSSKVFENDKSYLLELTPTNKAFKEFFKNIVLVVEKTDFTARSITMNEPSGDNTVMTFTSKKLNQALDASLFKI